MTNRVMDKLVNKPSRATDDTNIATTDPMATPPKSGLNNQPKIKTRTLGLPEVDSDEAEKNEKNEDGAA